MRSPSKAGGRSWMQKERASLYEDITVKIIAELEAGRLPWVQPWAASSRSTPLGLPKNAATGRHYSGINILILWSAVIEEGFASQNWLTFRQALSLGGHIRKGEHGTTVVFAGRLEPEKRRDQPRRADGKAKAIPFLKRFTVFNVEQCNDLPDAVAAVTSPIEPNLILPQAEALIAATGADLRIGGERACYDVAGDFIRIPPPQAYFEPVNWHRTALHELGHWTGAACRLGRDLTGPFGSKSYAQEEMIAEMAAAFSCAALGIVPTVRHADYIGSWLDVLREDHRAIIRAASAASKASDYLLSFLPDQPADGKKTQGSTNAPSDPAAALAATPPAGPAVA